jgi:HK97 family phage portal protein
LLDFPNPEMSSIAFWETTIQHAIGWGKGLAEIVRNGRDEPVELWPMDPARTEVKRDDAERLLYVVHNPDGSTTELADRDVFHVHGIGYDGTTGYSVATLARQSLGLSMAQLRSGAAFFRNGARPGGVIETDGRLGDEEQMQRFLRLWNAQHQGADNTAKVGLLEDGMKFKGISIPNSDAQWIESRGMSVVDLARWLRLPPHKIGWLDKATFSNIEQQSIEYVTDTLMPWAVRIEQETRRKLVHRDAEPMLFTEHVFEALLRGDLPSRNTAYATARQWGWMSVNDVLELENRNGIGEIGDVYLTPMNMQNAEQLLEPPEPEPTDDFPGDADGPSLPPPSGDEPDTAAPAVAAAVGLLAADKAREAARHAAPNVAVDELAALYQPALADAVGRCVHVARERTARKARRPGLDLNDWAAGWFPTQRQRVFDTLVVPVRQFVTASWAATGGLGPLPDALTLAVDKYAGDMADRHIKDSVEQVATFGPAVVDVWKSRADADAADEMMELRGLLRGVTHEVTD